MPLQERNSCGAALSRPPSVSSSIRGDSRWFRPQVGRRGVVAERAATHERGCREPPSRSLGGRAVRLVDHGSRTSADNDAVVAPSRAAARAPTRQPAGSGRAIASLALRRMLEHRRRCAHADPETSREGAGPGSRVALVIDQVVAGAPNPGITQANTNARVGPVECRRWAVNAKR
jgi:hypothetical protein